MSDSEKKYLISKKALENILTGLSTDKPDIRLKIFWSIIEPSLVEGVEKK